MPGPYTYTGLDTTTPTVTGVDPNEVNKAPLLALWLYMITDWDTFEALTDTDKNNIADSLNTTRPTVDAFFNYALANKATFQPASQMLDTFVSTIVYTGPPPTQQCHTSGSMPALASAAATTWNNTPAPGFSAAMMNEGLRLQAAKAKKT